MNHYKKNSFCWLFDPRFDSLLQHFLNYLQLKGCKTINPIIIRPFLCKEKTHFKSLVLDHKSNNANNIIIQHDPEELNRSFFQQKANYPILNPNSVYPSLLISFTNLYLKQNSHIKIYGPDPELVHKIDSKTRQFTIFEKLGIPLPEYKITQNFREIKHKAEKFLSYLSAFVVLPEHSAGGYKARLISRKDDIAEYETFLKKTAPNDLNKSFLLSKYIKPIMVPSCNALITKKAKIIPLAITELLFNDLRFSGFLYPSFIKQDIQNKIINYTQTIGAYLAEQGYQGFFTTDWLLDQNEKLLFTEVNPRFSCEAGFLFSEMNYNLFSVLEGKHDDKENYMKTLSHRTLMFKISPIEGKTYISPFSEQNSLKKFLAYKTEHFKEYYFKTPVTIKNGTVLGLAGKRFSLNQSRDTVINFWEKYRIQG